MKRTYIAKRFQQLRPGLSLDTAALARYDDVIDLSIDDTDLVTDSRIIDTAFADAKAGYTHYGSPKGDPELIAAIRRAWEEDYGQTITQDRVLVTASTCLGMAIVMMGILDPGDEVLVLGPYFSPYRGQIELAGGVCVEVPCFAEEGYALNEQRLCDAVTERTKAIIFDNPCNPTGMAYQRDELEIIARVAKRYDLLVAADEIYTTYLGCGTRWGLQSGLGRILRTSCPKALSHRPPCTRRPLIHAFPASLRFRSSIPRPLSPSAPQSARSPCGRISGSAMLPVTSSACAMPPGVCPRFHI